MGEELDVSKLLRLKRYEMPPADYFDDFLFEFHRRQRAELLQRSTRQVLWERILSLAPSFRVPQLAYAAVAVLAVATSAIIMTRPAAPLVAQTSARSSLSLTAHSPVTFSDASPASANADGSLPPQYVLQARPPSNEQPLSF